MEEIVITVDNDLMQIGISTGKLILNILHVDNEVHPEVHTQHSENLNKI